MRGRGRGGTRGTEDCQKKYLHRREGRGEEPPPPQEGERGGEGGRGERRRGGGAWMPFRGVDAAPNDFPGVPWVEELC